MLRLAVARDSTEHMDFTSIAFRHEKITVGCGAYQPWLIEAGCVPFNREAGGDLRPGVFGAWDHLRRIAGGRRCERSGQILERDLTNRTGLLESVVGERSLWRGRVDTNVNRFLGRQGNPRRARLGSAKDSNVVDDLPALLIRQGLPGGHAIVGIASGDVPKKLAVAGRLRRP